MYRSIKERSDKPAAIVKRSESKNKPGLEQRLKQIERTLQSLRRDLPAADQPSSKTSTDDTDVEENLETLDLNDHTFVASVTNSSALQELFSAHEQLQELFNSLPVDQASPPSNWSQEAPPGESKHFWQSRLDMSTTVLSCFPSLPLCNDLARAYFEGFYQIRPVVPREWVDQILTDLFRLNGLSEPRTTSGIIEAATQIDSDSCPLDWNQLGVLLCMFSMAAYQTPGLLDANWLAFYETILEPSQIRTFAFKMKDLVGICWQLSDPHVQATESLVLFLYFYFMLHLVTGELSKYTQLRKVAFFC